MSRHVEPIDRAIYNGRVYLGRIITAKSGTGFDAFDRNGKHLGRLNSEGAAAHIVLSGLAPRTDKPREGGCA